MKSSVSIEIKKSEFYKLYKNESYKDTIISFFRANFTNGSFLYKYLAIVGDSLTLIFEYNKNINNLYVNFGESGKLEKSLNVYFKDYFDLEGEMRKLVVKNFDHNVANYKLCYDHTAKKINKMFNRCCACPNDIYFTEDSLDNFLEKIQNKNISVNEFFETYKKVFGGK